VFFKVTSGDTLYKSAKTFQELNLSEDLLKGLYAEMKFERPSKIQAVSLPMILTPPPITHHHHFVIDLIPDTVAHSVASGGCQFQNWYSLSLSVFNLDVDCGTHIDDQTFESHTRLILAFVRASF